MEYLDINRSSDSTVQDVANVFQYLRNDVSKHVNFLLENLKKEYEQFSSSQFSQRMIEDSKSLCLLLKVKWYWNSEMKQPQLESAPSLNLASFVEVCLESIQTYQGGEEKYYLLLLDTIKSSMLFLNKPDTSKILCLMIRGCKNLLDKHINCETGNENISYEESKALNIIVDILDVILYIYDLYSTHLTTGSDDRHQIYVEFFNDIETTDLILEILFLRNDNIATKSMLYLIPKVVDISHNVIILCEVWNKLCILFESNDCKVNSEKAFFILFALSSFYLPISKSNYFKTEFCLLEYEHFWNMIQNGLPNKSQFIRKQALYMVKRSIDCATICNKELCVGNAPNYLFHWNPAYVDCSLKPWNDMFLIFEVLEEKQMHLIKPVLSIIFRFIEEYKNFHKSWLLCIFQRLMTHENSNLILWGLLNMDKIEFILIPDTKISCLLFSSFVCALNNSFMYTKNLDVPNRVCVILKNIITSEFSVCKLFFNKLIDQIILNNWGPVPFFYLTYVLSSMPKVGIWNEESLQKFKKMVSFALSSQHLYIRCATQCLLLKSLIQLLDVKEIDVATLASILGSFSSKESLKRGTLIWKEVILWLKTFDKKQLQVYVSDTLNHIYEIKHETRINDINLKTIARIIVLILDAEILSPNYVLKDSLLSKLFEAINPDYQGNNNEHLLDSAIEIISYVLQESKSVTSSNEDQTRCSVISCINTYVSGIFKYLTKRLLVLSNENQIGLVEKYCNVLNSLIEDPSLLPVIVKHFKVFQDTAICSIDSNNDSIPPIRVYFGMKVLAWVSHCLKLYDMFDCDISNSVSGNKHMTFIQMFIKGCNFGECSGSKFLKGSMVPTKVPGKIITGYLYAVWEMISVFLDTYCNNDLSQTLQSVFPFLVMEAFDSINIGGRGICIPVMRTIKLLLKGYLLIDAPLIAKFLNNCWTNIFELRWTEHFWISMQAFLNLIFQENLITCEDMHQHIFKFVQKILQLGDSITGICNLMLISLQKVPLETKLLVPSVLCNILVEAMTYGSSHRKDLKLEYETCTFIESLEDNYCVSKMVLNPSGENAEVRARAILILLETCESDQSFASKVFNLILAKDSEVSQGKIRYFGDSQHHRFKHRVLQVLLILEPFLSQEDKDEMFDVICNSLFAENHQPSIRYYQEWLIVRLMYSNKVLRSRVWNILQEAHNRRTGSVCSFIAVLFHLSRILLNEAVCEEFISRVIKEICPWSMGQHFSIRLYAQVTIHKLLETCKDRNFKDVLTTYNFLDYCLQTSLTQGNYTKNANKLLEDFYFCDFHCIDHYSFETIFWEFPRLANVSCDEWISVDILLKCGIFSATLPLENKNNTLRKYDNATWLTKLPIDGDSVDQDLTQGRLNIQKKIIPWANMLPDLEFSLGVTELALQRRKASIEKGLIVVASLIDRLPNLGGLSRTCEIFGVSEFVVGNLKCVEDKQFQTLSVSADKWISISEIKPQSLHQYLQAVRASGYTLVGVEQTLNSVKLDKYTFPKKSLLLLGNEREGIPADLLPLLHVCIEIPQQGWIRSLNVHVTGALCIWEYARQHSLS